MNSIANSKQKRSNDTSALHPLVIGHKIILAPYAFLRGTLGTILKPKIARTLNSVVAFQHTDKDEVHDHILVSSTDLDSLVGINGVGSHVNEGCACLLVGTLIL